MAVTKPAEGQDQLSIYVVPLIVAIIAAIATSWNFIQAKWNGHYFQQLILKELAELHPDLVHISQCD